MAIAAMLPSSEAADRLDRGRPEVGQQHVGLLQQRGRDHFGRRRDERLHVEHRDQRPPDEQQRRRAEQRQQAALPARPALRREPVARALVPPPDTRRGRGCDGGDGVAIRPSSLAISRSPARRAGVPPARRIRRCRASPGGAVPAGRSARSRARGRDRAASISTCCPRNAASWMLWVTNRMVVPVSRQTCSSSSFSRSRVISSSAPNGSSISRMRGSPSSARAIDTRWRMPPDSSCGSACSQPARPTSASSSSGLRPPRRQRAPPADLQRQAHIVERAAPRQQRRRPGTRSRSRGCAVPRRVPGRARARCRWSAARCRRPRAAASTCRSRTGRAASGSCPGCRLKLMSSSAVTSRRSLMNRTVTSRSSTAGASAGTACRRRQWPRPTSSADPSAGPSAVAFRMSSVMTSSSFGVRLVNWPSCAHRSIWSCHTAGSIVP